MVGSGLLRTLSESCVHQKARKPFKYPSGSDSFKLKAVVILKASLHYAVECLNHWVGHPLTLHDSCYSKWHTQMVHLFSNSAALAFFGRSLPRSTQPHTALGTCWHGWIHDRFFRANAATLYLSMTFADIWLWWTSLLPSTVKLFPIKIC